MNKKVPLIYDQTGPIPFPKAAYCQHCQRVIVLTVDGWKDPDATGDDSIWAYVCDAHDTMQADHQPHD